MTAIGMIDSPIAGVSAVTLRDRIASGALTVVELCEHLCDHVRATEPQIGAFAWFDRAHVLEQAVQLDAYRKTGRPLGPLHGIPVALKDIIDTVRIPTENGTVIDSGRMPSRDAVIVSRLKAAGAVIFGKTVTTELASMEPAATMNPFGVEHTPGGSSAGSAAAVAAGMVPIAIGTQTGGSVIRPASFCGTFGYKPTFGLIPRTGILAQSPSMDTVGVFANHLDDVALVTDVLSGFDEGDVATSPGPAPRLLEIMHERVPVIPTFAVVHLPSMERVSEPMRLALSELLEVLGDQVFETGLPNAFSEAVIARDTVNLAEMAKCYYRYGTQRDHLSESIRSMLARGEQVLARDYLAALDWKALIVAALDEIFERCDVILAPAAFGEAPKDRTTTGDPMMNGLWTFSGHPVVTIPVFEGANGMPMGLQMIGKKGMDGRLLRTARWLVAHIDGVSEDRADG
jgi:Asp-tRNA(Asn)/Glu-tRNA(Gln) amidotransferase A subunit family amidase